MGDARRRILLGVDGSECSIDAIRYVASFFQPRKTDVVLFHVKAEVPEAFLDRGKEAGLPAHDLPMDDWARETKRRLEGSLEKGREILSAAGFPRKAVTAKIRSRESGIARDLLKEAREGYGVVVVGRTGLSQVKGVVLGSVAHKLITKMHPVPIAVVGGTPETKHVLIGFDGSKGSKRAVDCACSAVPARDREVTLCFVVRSLGAHLGDLAVFQSDHEKRWLEASRQEMELSLEEAETRLITAGFHPSRVFVRQLENQTSRAQGILAATKNGPCGTVVVGRRGHTSVEEFPMGRVPWKLLQMARDLAVWVV
jgi:nucleotide-binding universal stress UspA family protein